MSVVLDVAVREESGTGNAREARRNGFVPGIVYGGEDAPISVSMKFNEVLKAHPNWLKAKKKAKKYLLMMSLQLSKLTKPKLAVLARKAVQSNSGA